MVFKILCFVCACLSLLNLSWFFVGTVVPIGQIREITETLTDILSFVLTCKSVVLLFVSKYHIVIITAFERVVVWCLGSLLPYVLADYSVNNTRNMKFHRLPFLFALCGWIPLSWSLVRVGFRNVWRLRAFWMVFIQNEGEVVSLFYIIIIFFYKKKSFF